MRFLVVVLSVLGAVAFGKIVSPTSERISAEHPDKAGVNPLDATVQKNAAQQPMRPIHLRLVSREDPLTGKILDSPSVRTRRPDAVLGVPKYGSLPKNSPVTAIEFDAVLSSKPNQLVKPNPLDEVPLLTDVEIAQQIKDFALKADKDKIDTNVTPGKPLAIPKTVEEDGAVGESNNKKPEATSTTAADTIQKKKKDGTALVEEEMAVHEPTPTKSTVDGAPQKDTDPDLDGGKAGAQKPLKNTNTLTDQKNPLQK